MLKDTTSNSPVTATKRIEILEREKLELMARIAELERLTALDTLTPLFNRRHLMHELDRWCWRAHRYGGTFGLLYLDVDRLKAVNDTHGHVAGDAVLCAVAAAIGGAIRKSDVAARLGGDEFAILLDQIDRAGLVEKASAMRKLFTAFPAQTAGPVLNVDISLGHSLIEAGSSASEVMIEADRTMYADKRAKYPE